MSSSLRRVPSPARIIRRYASSANSNPKKSSFLTPEKKRALISLYHQSDTFITPENLSDRIDQAFLKRSVVRTQLNRYDMEGLIKDQRVAPKFSEWARDRRGSVGVGGEWSGSTTPREWRVIEALYGVDASDTSHAMPGQEALEDFSESEDSLEIDKEERLRNGSSDLNSPRNARI
ncbi:hypothetical protein E1B28_004632 [Marasmius oreades]|uniref:Uncharacterized protein n=1 Tax=Marasmius oreades TaxID=181124 RepID=A0A9P7UYY3_9AGAR|nr:uncharacterized protein E1B28_004632 [Marasmius oreades]KAG7097266.1 hypothetical protein E1B28_004632 [Marasmius oreades]